MPVSLSDWLPEEHFAWFVLEAVEQLDLSAFHAADRDDRWGRQAYDPAMMLALLLRRLCPVAGRGRCGVVDRQPQRPQPARGWARAGASRTDSRHASGCAAR